MSQFLETTVRNILLLISAMGLIGLGKSAQTEVKTTIGLFEKFVWNDYLYLNLKEPSGKESQYYCNLPKCAEWEMKESELKNKKVLLKWKESEFFVKELGQTKKIHEVVDLELLKVATELEKR